MTLVKEKDLPTAWSKVTIGNKDHHTKFTEIDVKKYADHAAECILLGNEIDESNEVKYKYRQFKTMRPKGVKKYKKHEQSNS